jgi:hypothetical protein
METGRATWAARLCQLLVAGLTLGERKMWHENMAKDESAEGSAKSKVGLEDMGEG